MVELLAVVVGAAIGYLLSTHQGRTERGQHRAALATALLAELRTLEFALYRHYSDKEIGYWHGRIPSDWFERLGDHFLLFTPRTVDATLRLRGYLRYIQEYRDGCVARPPEEITERDHWKINVYAGYALQIVPELKRLLESEGGISPDQTEVTRLAFPDLPTLPQPGFEWRIVGKDGRDWHRDGPN